MGERKVPGKLKTGQKIIASHACGQMPGKQAEETELCWKVPSAVQ